MSYVNYHPVFLALDGKEVLIVGGGKVAMEKLESLLPSGARITVVAPDATPQIQAWHEEGVLHWKQRRFETADVDECFMVVAATDVPETNALVFQTGEAQHRLANSVDDPVNCNFIMSAITRQGPMQVAVSSAGCSPALAQRLRKKIAEDLLTPEVGELADFLGSWRPAVKEALSTYKEKQAFWEAAIDSDIPRILHEEGRPKADEAMAQRLGGLEAPKIGHVYLVGAGPGDPELMTLKGFNALERADVVLYDRLANSDLLKYAKPSARFMDVGKAPGECGRPRQEMIHAIMIEHARSGKVVVRLKGGDPFVFGRGGEEILALQEAGISYDVVPGISSSIAAPGAAGIPVTHRGLATGFAVFTAQGAAQEIDTVPWASLREVPTLIFLMGVEKLPHIAKNLLANGLPKDMPVAVISQATLPTQEVAVGTLATITDLAGHLPSPATIVVGQVVTLYREKIGQLTQLTNSVG